MYKCQINATKKQGKAPKRSTWKMSKFYWRRKRKSVKIIVNVTKNLSEDQKQNLVEHTRNYYIIHKR